MKTLNYIAIILLSGFIVGCSLEPMIRPDGSVIKKYGDTTITIPIDTSKNGNNNGNTGSNNGNNNNNTTNSTSYFPMTAGSTWKYMVEVIGGQKDSMRVTMTDQQVAVSSKQFTTVNLTGANGQSKKEYYALINNVVYWRTSTGPNDYMAEVPVIKLDAGILSTFKYTPAATMPSLPEELVTSMMGIDLSHTVNGKIYNNVHHAVTEQRITVNGKITVATVFDFYFAKGIGIIESTITQSGMALGHQTLVSYNVK